MEPGESLNQVAKRRALILLIAALVAAVLLASSLSNLELSSGQPFPGAGSSTSTVPELTRPTAAGASDPLPIVQGVLATTLLILLIWLLIRLIARTSLKDIAGLILALAVLLILLLSLPRVPPGTPVSLAQESAAPGVPSTPYPTSPLGKPPQQFVWVVTAAVLAGAGFVVLAALRRAPRDASVSSRLGQEAERAVQALGAGADSTNVIVRCYLQMIALIHQERGLDRERSLTAREFEDVLESRGLPRRPLLRLRSVFEDVRYGNRSVTRAEEQIAVESLSEIAALCRPGSV